jgi:hypothetical protein
LGLLKTIGSVGNVISGLGIDDTNVAGFFNSLKDGLNAPLQGMSIAFSSSLLGLGRFINSWFYGYKPWSSSK